MAISISAIICVIVELMTPNGKTEKLVHFALGAFMICAMLTPIENTLSNIDFKINNTTQNEISKNTIISHINSQADELATKNLNDLVTAGLKRIDVVPKNTKINFIDNDKKSISQVACTIYICKEDSFKKHEIKKIIKQDFGFDCTVKLVK